MFEINLDNDDDANVEKVEKFTMCMVCEWHVHNVFSMVRKSFPLAGLQFQTGGAEDLPQANNSAQVHMYHRHRYLHRSIRDLGKMSDIFSQITVQIFAV